MQQIYLLESIVTGYARKAMKTINDITHHSHRATIDHRVKVINFFDRYGEGATKEAFGVSRSTVYLWKQKLKHNRGRLSALAPGDKAPKARRKRTVDSRITNYIIDQRTRYPGKGKDKLAVEPGRVLSRPGHTAALRLHGRQNHSRSPAAGPNTPKHPVVPQRQDRPTAGEKIQAETQETTPRRLPTPSSRRLGPDRYRRRHSSTGSDATSSRPSIIKAGSHSPMPTKVPHQPTRPTSLTNWWPWLRSRWPICTMTMAASFTNTSSVPAGPTASPSSGTIPGQPRHNGMVERFNRTIQEEYIDYCLDELALETDDFNRHLMDWLVYYNTGRPHHSLKLQSPMQHILGVLQLPTKESNMLWTNTLFIASLL
ncbi:hypothetical protein BRC20_01225 [Candidatus Saccharibacteria bacterium QS_8_54_8]|nr:MAG: hypothetical protein BRC20_01225 [Candidatus Saccharibacteria bacterium QS_8_54_8]